MASGQNSLDFSGYTTGAPSHPAGMLGLLDFIGYPVGKTSTPEPPQVNYQPRGGKPKRKDMQEEELLLLL